MKRSVVRADFDPVLQIGDIFAMLGANGFKQASEGGSGTYVCTGYDSTMLALGQHGVIVVWADSGAAPAGYAADPGMVAATNHIAAGASYAYLLQSLQFLKGQVAQLRFRVKKFAGITGALDDYDVTLYSPPATQRGKFLRVGGVINAMFQGQDPGDTIAAPAQGADIALPATYPGLLPSDFSVRTQLFLLENASAQISILNNGAGNTAGGAIGLVVSGWVYNFEPIENYADLSGKLIPREVLPGAKLLLPAQFDPQDLAILQVEARAPK